MNTQEAYKLLIPLFGNFDKYDWTKQASAASSDRYNNSRLLISPEDTLGMFFAVPARGWVGYVNNNPEDSFYMLRELGQTLRWKEGENVYSKYGEGWSYTWAPSGAKTYDITDLVLRSPFTFLNWITRNPMEVKE